MRGVDSRQVVTPEAELRHGAETREEDSPPQHFEIAHRWKEKHQRNDDQTGDLENAQQFSPRDDPHRQERQYEPPRQPAELLDGLHGSDFALNQRLSLRRLERLIHLHQRRHDLRQLLDRTEGRSQTAREDQRTHQAGLPELLVQNRSDACPAKGPGGLLLLPYRRFRQERPDNDQRYRRNQTRE